MQVDAFVLRHPSSGSANLISRITPKPVINAGDGSNEHPTQALLDMFTLRQHFGSIKGLKVTIIGDVLHSRVARSNIYGLLALGAEVGLCSPVTLLPRMPKNSESVSSPTLTEQLPGPIPPLSSGCSLNGPAAPISPLWRSTQCITG